MTKCIPMFITSIWCSTIATQSIPNSQATLIQQQPMWPQHIVAMQPPTAGSSSHAEPTKSNEGLPVSVKDTPKPKDKNVIWLQVCISLPVVISCTHFFHREIYGLTWNGKVFDSGLGKRWRPISELHFCSLLPNLWLRGCSWRKMVVQT